MEENPGKDKTCVIIGASHAGVSAAFSLRREGWQGEILLYDTDSNPPYHRPPLSKAYLTSEDGLEKNILKSAQSYEKEHITLCLGMKVGAIHRNDKTVDLEDGSIQKYDKLVIATGARPIIPPIPGIDLAKNLFTIRTAEDAQRIRNAILKSKHKRVVVIGGGYIGLEVAASLIKLGALVTLLERESRLLSRVTSPVLSDFFQKLHTEKGVRINTDKNVSFIESSSDHNVVHCEDGSRYDADMIVLGVGIQVNIELAQEAGLEIENGIKVNAVSQTSDKDIYAIGDCTFHHNPHYDCFVRLESVQNAVDQAKIAAAAICGKPVSYNSIPWFWSDQFDIKFQMVGLSAGYDQLIFRKEVGEKARFSVWYFRKDELLAVDAVNHPKAYVLGTKCIKGGQLIDKTKLGNSEVELKPANLLV